MLYRKPKVLKSRCGSAAAFSLHRLNHLIPDFSSFKRLSNLLSKNPDAMKKPLSSDQILKMNGFL